jgi:hypothetical protein
VEFNKPDVNIALRDFVLRSGRPYDRNVMQRLSLLHGARDFRHHPRCLLDAVQ